MNRRWGGVAFYLALLLMLLAGMAFFRPSSQAVEEISYTAFIEQIENKNVSKIDLKGSQATVTLKDETVEKVNIPAMAQDGLYENHLRESVENGEISLTGHPESNTSSSMASFIPSLIMFGLLGFMLLTFIRNTQGSGGKMMSFGKSKARLIKEEDGEVVSFKDVAGLEEEKEELSEIVEFLKNPRKFIQMGARIPKGVLLVGPPGTGKTYLSKSVAGEAKVPFYIMSGSDFVEMYVGVGASRVRDLFETAKKNAPCIIFIDEIDAVGRRRGAGVGGGHDEREQTLNQLLVEMDGFGTNEGVIVMAATNRADILDPAILRPGRFDRTVYVGLPDVRAREEILKVHSRKKPLAKGVDLKVTAKRTPGFTPADLENLMNEAALLAARRNMKKIETEDLEEASIKVQAGPAKKSSVVSEKERKLTAVHEAGHAIVGRLLPNHDPVHMITIIPRGRAGGFTAYLPEDDVFHYTTKGEMKNQLVSLLGGRVAESLVLDDISTGASNDIERVTKIARDMVTKYGMSEKIGTLTYGSDEEAVFMGKDFGSSREYSEEIASEIDAEMRQIVNEAYTKAETLIRDNMDTLLRVADALLEKETLTGKEFEILFTGEELPKDEDSKDEHIEEEDLSEEAKEIVKNETEDKKIEE
ncbi:ATP-dependent zinc metalloprotease FtsH [Peptoniphilus sp. KCTC 25270]|uniref:ATP-dependent zinc metalloprotease FtsH n=1 Tax=Peptoniphilus sp. KCTC 25270 TaxID=2897414 RepID=UPI002102B048|nr:ATP-dependent zinc metalloprotease FtsH [Peptoniphilus sp. KCTC 25270]